MNSGMILSAKFCPISRFIAYAILMPSGAMAQSESSDLTH
jgi:hypothetical protein